MVYYYTGGKKYESKEEYKQAKAKAKLTPSKTTKTSSKSTSIPPAKVTSGVVITTPSGEKYTVVNGQRKPITTTQAQEILTSPKSEVQKIISQSQPKVDIPAPKAITGIAYDEKGLGYSTMYPESVQKVDIPKPKISEPSVFDKNVFAPISQTTRKIEQSMIPTPSSTPTPSSLPSSIKQTPKEEPKLVKEGGKTYVKYGGQKLEWSEREFNKRNLPREIYAVLPSDLKVAYEPRARTQITGSTVVYGLPGQEKTQVVQPSGEKAWVSPPLTFQEQEKLQAYSLFVPEVSLAGTSTVEDYKPPLKYNPDTKNYYVEYGNKKVIWDKSKYDMGELPVTITNLIKKDIEAGKTPVVAPATQVLSMVQPTAQSVEDVEYKNYQDRLNIQIDKLNREKAKGIFANPIILANYENQINIIKTEIADKYPDLKKQAEKAYISPEALGSKYTENDFSKSVEKIDSFSKQAARDSGFTGKEELSHAESHFLNKGVLAYNVDKVQEYGQSEYDKRSEEQIKLANKVNDVNEQIKEFNEQYNKLDETYKQSGLNDDIIRANALADSVLYWEQRAKQTQSQFDIDKYNETFDEYDRANKVIEGKKQQLETKGYFKNADDLDKQTQILESKSEQAKKYVDDIERLEKEKEHIAYKVNEEVKEIKNLDYFYRRKQEGKQQLADVYTIEDKYKKRQGVAIAKLNLLGLDVAERVKGALSVAGVGAGRELTRDVLKSETPSEALQKGVYGLTTVGQAQYRGKSLYSKKYEDMPWTQAVNWEEVRGAADIALAAGTLPGAKIPFSGGKYLLGKGGTSASALIRAHPVATQVGQFFGVAPVVGDVAVTTVQEVGAVTAKKEEQPYIRDILKFEQGMRTGSQAERRAVGGEGGFIGGLRTFAYDIPLVSFIAGDERAFEESVRDYYTKQGYTPQQVETAVNAAKRQRASGFIGEGFGIAAANISSELLGRGLLTKQAGAVIGGKVKPWTAFKRIGTAGFIEGYVGEGVTQKGRYEDEDEGAKIRTGVVGGITAGTIGAGLSQLRGGGRLTGKARPWSRFTGPAKASVIEKGLYVIDPWEYVGDISATGIQKVSGKLGKIPVFTGAFSWTSTPTYSFTEGGKRVKGKADVITPAETQTRKSKTSIKEYVPVETQTKKSKAYVTEFTPEFGTFFSGTKQLTTTPVSITPKQQVQSLIPTFVEVTPRTYTEIEPFVQSRTDVTPQPKPYTEVVTKTETQTRTETQPYTDTETFVGTQIPTGLPLAGAGIPGLPEGGYQFGGYGRGISGWNINNMIRDIAGEWRTRKFGPLFTQQTKMRQTVGPTSKEKAQGAVDKMFGTRKKLIDKDIKKLI